MHALDGPRAKVRVAKLQVVALQERVERFFRDNPYEIGVAEHNAKSGRHVLRVVSGPESLPTEWGVYIGEIVHDLRSALDELICALALRRTCDRSVCSETAFPIYLRGPRTSAKRRKAGRRRLAFSWTTSDIRPLSKSDKEAIEGFQPYKRGNRNRKSLLWLLHELNNTDKHRLITVVSPAAHGLTFTGFAGQTKLKAGVPLRPKAKVGWVAEPPAQEHGEGRGGIYVIDPTTGKLVEPKMQVNVDVAPGIRFGDTCKAVEGLPVIGTLQRMANEVSRVVESFAGEF